MASGRVGTSSCRLRQASTPARNSACARTPTSVPVSEGRFFRVIMLSRVDTFMKARYHEILGPPRCLQHLGSPGHNERELRHGYPRLPHPHACCPTRPYYAPPAPAASSPMRRFSPSWVRRRRYYPARGHLSSSKLGSTQLQDIHGCLAHPRPSFTTMVRETGGTTPSEPRYQRLPLHTGRKPVCSGSPCATAGRQTVSRFQKRMLKLFWQGTLCHLPRPCRPSRPRSPGPRHLRGCRPRCHSGGRLTGRDAIGSGTILSPATIARS